MTSGYRDFLVALPGELPAFIRIATAMMLMPGLGEAAAPTIARIGLSSAVGIALCPTVDLSGTSPGMPISLYVFVILGEAVTGLWFGWLCRLVALALLIAGQYAGFMVGLSNVLQTERESEEQSGALGALFGLVAPMVILSSGLYRLQMQSLAVLFDIIPPGHVLPVADSVAVGVNIVSTTLGIALQVASPFIVCSILWNLFIGQVARLAGRLQVYFISFPGQMLLGFFVLLLSTGPIIVVWQRHAESLFRHLPVGL